MKQIKIINKNKNSLAFSSQADHTDRATTATSANLAQTFADRRCCVVSEAVPYGR
jgi:hypothetical protein